MKVGTIWYHPLAGFGRPFIVRRIDNGVAYSENLDDGGQVSHSEKELETFLAENPEFALAAKLEKEEKDGD